jgi:hypothetical protein
MALTLLSGCSTYDNLFGSRASSTPSAQPASAASSAPTAPPAPAASRSSSFTDRFSNFVLGGPATTAAASGPGLSPSDIDCPRVEVRQGASTFAQSAPDNGSAALSLQYQSNFVRFARECALHGANITMKVGVEGRIILGPAGAPAQITLPVRLAVVREGLESKTIWTKFYQVPVTLPPGQPNYLFTHVEEDMTFPMPPGNELDEYVIYVGFDPDTAEAERSRKPTKPAVKKKPKA